MRFQNSPYKYAILEPATFALDGGAMFGIIPKTRWSKVVKADEYNRMELALRLLLIKTSERVIVVDTGIGNYHDDKFNEIFNVNELERSSTSPLESSLNTIGLAPNDVTDLVISHLHFDHAGGIVKKVGQEFVPVLPNARLHLHKQHYEYAHNPTERDAGSFQAKYFDQAIDHYQRNNLLIYHEGESGTLMELDNAESLKFRCSHGHTPFLMHPYDNYIIYLADLIPTSHHVHIPWVMGYDIAPGVTTQDKRRVLDFICQENLTVIFEHDTEYWGSSVELSPKGKFTCKQKHPRTDQNAYWL